MRCFYGPILQVSLAAMPIALAYPMTARAHCEVGDRTFASTITFDDPCVTDELSLPTIQSFKNGDQPSAQELDISGEYTKTITRNFGISLEEEWVHLDIPGEGNRSGFDNLGTSFKYQFVRNADRELAMSVALDVDWGGNGGQGNRCRAIHDSDANMVRGKRLRLRGIAISPTAGCYSGTRLLIARPILHDRN